MGEFLVGFLTCFRWDDGKRMEGAFALLLAPFEDVRWVWSFFLFNWKKLFRCHWKPVRLKGVVGKVRLAPYLGVAPIMEFVALVCGWL